MMRGQDESRRGGEERSGREEERNITFKAFV